MSHVFIGNFDRNRAGHEESYFIQRHTNIDFRGDLDISPLSEWGYFNTVITTSHDIELGSYSPGMITKKVLVDDYAWITSQCILYNCIIGHHAIVSIGSVVANMTVEPYTIVAGNPALPIKKWDGEKWISPMNKLFISLGETKRGWVRFQPLSPE